MLAAAFCSHLRPGHPRWALLQQSLGFDARRHGARRLLTEAPDRTRSTSGGSTAELLPARCGSEIAGGGGCAPEDPARDSLVSQAERTADAAKNVSGSFINAPSRLATPGRPPPHPALPTTPTHARTHARPSTRLCTFRNVFRILQVCNCGMSCEGPSCWFPERESLRSNKPTNCFHFSLQRADPGWGCRAWLSACAGGRRPPPICRTFAAASTRRFAAAANPARSLPAASR